MEGLVGILAALAKPEEVRSVVRAPEHCALGVQKPARGMARGHRMASSLVEFVRMGWELEPAQGGQLALAHAPGTEPVCQP